MELLKKLDTADTPTMAKRYRKLICFGGYAAILAFLLTLTDIIFGSISSGNLSALPQTALEKFSEFQQNRLLGLYHLDLLNVIISIVMVPLYLALFVVHRKASLSYAAVGLVFAIIGTTVFISTNTALPMLELSNKYFATGDETQRTLFAAAGEAFIARGEHGGLGVFIGFTLSTLSGILMSFAMLHEKVFQKAASLFGIIGNILLLTYVVLMTFFPSVESIAVIIAAPGGLASLVWLFMVGIKLMKEKSTDNQSNTDIAANQRS